MHKNRRNDTHYELILDSLNDQEANTSWNERKTATKTVKEASSTTYERNSRFGLIENGTWVTPDRFDELVSKAGTLYQFDVPPGETYIITGKERNGYVPGADYTSAFASQFERAGDGDNIVPEGVTITQGLGDFRDGQQEGIPLIFTPEDAQFAIFRDNELTNSRSLTGGEWDFDPFASEHFEYDVTTFAVKREEGNLYGSGSQRLYFKLRELETGKEFYIKVAEVGDPGDPILDQYNLFNQVKVDNDSTESYTVSVGPLQYFNEGEAAPGREKRSPKRDIPVNASLDDTVGTVIAVYRKDPNNIEVPIQARVAAKAQTDGRVVLREIHPEYVNFGTIDETDDANWRPPSELQARETGLQELDFTVGDVSIESVDGRARGEQSSYVSYDGQSNQGGQATRATATSRETINEFNYFVATAKHESTAENIIRYELLLDEEW